MKCRFSLVGGVIDGKRSIELELDVIPKLDDPISWPGIRDFQPHVRYLEWFLIEDDGTPIDKPFVYIVVGPKRPQY